MQLSIWIVSGEAGLVGGAARATVLLVEAIRRTGSDVHLFVSLPPDAETAIRLHRSGARLTVSPLRRGWRWHMPQCGLAAMVRLLMLRHNPSAVLCIGLGAEAYFLLRAHVPRLVLWETTDALPGNKFVDARLPGRLTGVERLLVPSKTIERHARATYKFEGTIDQLPFWVDAPHAPMQVRERSRNILYLGRMDPDKGLGDLFEAFASILERFPEATLTVCGGGDARAIRKVAFRGIDIRGFVTDAELEQAFSKAEIFVLPSLHEGYPLSLLEACGRGVPLVATRVGSIPEVFGGRRAASLIDAGAPEQIGAAVMNLFAERDEEYTDRCVDANALFGEVNSREAIDTRVAEIFRSIADCGQL